MQKKDLGKEAKSMKKQLVLLVAVILSLSMLVAGCGASPAVDSSASPAASTTTGTEATDDGETAASEDESMFNGVGIFPIVKVPGSVTLKVVVAPEPWLGQFSDNWMTEKYEEATGIKVEWQQIAREEAATKMNLMLTAGEGLPDIFMMSINKDLLSSYGGEGIFIPLNEYIDTIGTGIKIMTEADPLLLGQITAPDGNIYSLVERNECYHCDQSQRFYINQVWLDNLGLNMPTTIDEFYDVMKAFKTEDANGNGDPNDEIPLITTIDFWNGKLGGFLNNPFVFTPSTSGTQIYIDNGVVKSAVNQSGWRDSLTFLKKMYQEELIYDGAFTVTTDVARQLSGDPKGNRIGSFPGGYHGGVCDLNPDATAKDEYVALLPLKGPTGLQQTPLYYTSVNTCFAITRDSANPEAAFRWGDSMMLLANIDMEFKHGGPENEVWRKGEAGEVGLDGRNDPTKLIKAILQYGEPHNWHWGQPKPVSATNEDRFSSVSPQGAWDLETELFKARKAYTPFGNQENVLPLYMKTPEEAASISEYATLVETIDNYTALFVTGQKDLEKDWDEYLAAIDAEGLSAIIEIEQIAYDRFVENSK